MKIANCKLKITSQGFTLIELLVVIAIIGMLSAVVLASLNTARAKARDAKRFSDMNAIQTALELYANDNNGQYPVMGGWQGTTPNCYTNGGDPNTAIPGLVPNYIPTMPQDPKPTLPYYCYLYMSDGANYKFLAYGTSEAGAIAPGAAHARYPATGCGNVVAETSYSVYSSGGACW